jgi:hypothetical protein
LYDTPGIRLQLIRAAGGRQKAKASLDPLCATPGTGELCNVHVTTNLTTDGVDVIPLDELMKVKRVDCSGWRVLFACARKLVMIKPK